MHAHSILHDRANLVALPIVVYFAVVGLLGSQLQQQTLVQVIFGYLALDTVWIFVDDHAVPGAIQAIRIHHVGTLVMLLFPLIRPELSIFACLGALTEINTFFLIARRVFKQKRKLLTGFYWATFIPVRLVLFPLMLVKFWSLPLPLPERVVIWTLQLGLCTFNLGLVHRSWSSWRRNQRAQAQTSARVSEPTSFNGPGQLGHADDSAPQTKVFTYRRQQEPSVQCSGDSASSLEKYFHFKMETQGSSGSSSQTNGPPIWQGDL